MEVFEDSITQMLWPERRASDPVLGDRVPGTIDRTTATSYLRIPAGYLPDFVRRSESVARLIVPSLFNGEGGLEIGPVPKGTPVDLITNIAPLPEGTDPRQRLAHDAKVVELIVRLVRDLKRLPPNATDEQARILFADLAGPMFELSRCPDYVVNRGHYFGATLPDADKRALIEFLKTF
jgi:hypothetical protein